MRGNGWLVLRVPDRLVRTVAAKGCGGKPWWVGGLDVLADSDGACLWRFCEFLRLRLLRNARRRLEAQGFDLYVARAHGCARVCVRESESESGETREGEGQRNGQAQAGGAGAL